MFDGRWRDTVDRGTGPVGRRLQQIGISADVLTATGLSPRRPPRWPWPPDTSTWPSSCSS